MDLTIDKGVPVPSLAERVDAGGMKLSMPYADMEPGDSFFLPGKTAYRKVLQSSAQHARRHGKTFVVQRAEEEGQFGCRCWRTA